MSTSRRAEHDLQEELERLRALAHATAALSASRDFDETLHTMARLLVPTLADWCFVELVQPDGSIERRVIEAADPTKHELANRFSERFPLDPDSPVGSPAVIRSGRPELIAEIPDDFIDAVSDDEEYRAFLRRLDFKSALLVPLRVGARVVGDLALAQSESGRRFGEDDLEYVSDLAARCSLLLELQEREAAERAAREETEAILEGVADAVVVQDDRGELVYVNRAAVELFGLVAAHDLYLRGVEELRRMADLRDTAGRPVPLADLPGRRLLRGEDPRPLSVRIRGRWARMQARALRRPDGSVRRVITVIEDLTELTRAMQAQSFLAEASRILASSLDASTTLERVAALAEGRIAEHCAIELADPESPPPPGIVLTPDRIVVPLRVRDELLGTITLTGRDFDPDDLAVAHDLATRVALAVDHARLYEERSAIAHTLQASLLPPALPEIEGVTCAAVFRAAGEAHEVGGDFYDLFSTAAGEWYAVIGDVCGKGAEAAATTALVRYTVRAAAVRRRSPAKILHRLNEAMLRQEHDVTRFCTLAVARLDLDPGRGPVQVTAASGGHPLPRIVRAGGTVEELGTPGTLIGVTPDLEVEDATARLESGDALVLFTDGLTEAGAPRRVWSPDDLHEALAQAQAGAGDSIARLVEQLASAALGPLAQDPRDDIAVLGLRKT